jgi:alpha 1,2-mannosyltransferase
MIFAWPPRRARRYCSTKRQGGQLFIFLSLLGIISWCFLYEPSDTKPFRDQLEKTSILQLDQPTDLWQQLQPVLIRNDPKCDSPPELVVPRRVDIRFDPSHDHPRPDVVWLRPSDLERLETSHALFLRDIEGHPLGSSHQPGTTGILFTVGSNELPALVISLRMLRGTDCTLPVEVFLTPAAQYDAKICELVITALNGRCILAKNIIFTAGMVDHLVDDQWKALAVLFSSFDEVLVLDSDTFPTRNPTYLFEQQPFNSTGMILWPDFWYPSESPYFFDIARLGSPPALNTRAGVEAGQLMISKSKHAKTLALAAYYNYHGPKYYYPLLSQGGLGHKGKESFLWAATVTNTKNSFYLVRQHVLALGHTDSNGDYFGSGMAQQDPVEEVKGGFASSSQGRAGFGERFSLPSTNSSNETPLFVRVNTPQFNPTFIFSYGDEGTARPVFDSNGTAVRAWLPEKSAIELFGYDLENALWGEIQYIACEWTDMFANWVGDAQVCFNVKEYRASVFE